MQSYIQELIDRLVASKQKAESLFQSLNADQLNWKSDPKSWSIGQCLDHLMTTDKLYEPIFEKVKRGERDTNIFARIRFFSGFLGKALRKAMGPEVKRKAQSPANFRPSQSDIPADIVPRFSAHLTDLQATFKSLPEADFSKWIITSPAAAFITYSFEDALYVVTGHIERHLNQAERVLEAQGLAANV